MYTRARGYALRIDGVGSPDRRELVLCSGEIVPVAGHLVLLGKGQGRGLRITLGIDTNYQDCHLLRIAAQALHCRVQLFRDQWAYGRTVCVHKGYNDRFALELSERNRVSKLIRQLESGRR